MVKIVARSLATSFPINDVPYLCWEQLLAELGGDELNA